MWFDARNNNPQIKTGRKVDATYTGPSVGVDVYYEEDWMDKGPLVWFALKDVFVNLGLNLGELRDILLAMCQLLTQLDVMRIPCISEFLQNRFELFDKKVTIYDRDHATFWNYDPMCQEGGILFYLGTRGRKYGQNYAFPDHFLKTTPEQLTAGTSTVAFCPSLRSRTRGTPNPKSKNKIIENYIVGDEPVFLQIDFLKHKVAPTHVMYLDGSDYPEFQMLTKSPFQFLASTDRVNWTKLELVQVNDCYFEIPNASDQYYRSFRFQSHVRTASFNQYVISMSGCEIFGRLTLASSVVLPIPLPSVDRVPKMDFYETM